MSERLIKPLNEPPNEPLTHPLDALMNDPTNDPMHDPITEAPPASPIATVTAGWYGKLPSLGDFAARRLSDGFVAPWDAWLSARIAETQLNLGARWLSLYLTCPVWRFFAMPGAIAPGLQDCWMGILMASVDRVGRHFPLTIAAAVPSAPATGDDIARVWQWLDGVETVALAALDFDFTIDRLDEQLAALPVPLIPFTHPSSSSAPDMPAKSSTSAATSVLSMPRGPQPAAVLSDPWGVPSAHVLAERLATVFAPIWQTEAYGMSMWTAVPPDSGQPGEPPRADRDFTIWPAYGLPDTHLFTTMLLHHQQP
jgi:type VI secretion system protein ImpM